MLITDKKKITIPIEYPKSSMVIKNPHHKLALMFQVIFLIILKGIFNVNYSKISVNKDDDNN